MAVRSVPPEHRRTGLSIRYSLPLLTSAVSAVVIAAFAAAAYREVQASAVANAGQRLSYVSDQLAGMLGASTQQIGAQVDAAAADETLGAYLRDPSAARAAAALPSLAGSGNVLGGELRDRAGRRLLAANPNLPGGTEADTALLNLVAHAGGGAVIGPLRSDGDAVVAPVAAPIRAGDSVLGYLVQWRRLVASGQEQIEQLIGLGARMYLANESGDLWTDLAAVVPGPAVIPGELAGVFEHRDADGARWVGAVAPIAATPWVVVTEFPRDLAVAGSRAMLRSLILFGVLALLLAAAASWLLTGRFTAPILELAGTAQALSAGDYTRRSEVARGDELGVLSRSFNTMGENVAGAHSALENQVLQLAVLESQNREVRERLQHVLASSPDVIYELGVTNGHVLLTWVSENVQRLLGYSIEEAMAPGWRDTHLHPDDRAAHAAAWREFGGESDATREYRFRHADGRYRWIRDRQHVLRDDTGAVVEVVGAWSDITERRSLEEQFRQAQKLEAVGRLAGGVAHDFNNIVTVILGECDLALSALPHDAPIRDAIDQVRTAAERAALLTRQLLTFSRKQIIETTVFSLNDVVAEMRDMLGRLIGEDVDLQLRPARTPAIVSADRGQIEQVLMNLVINARDAMPDGGTIVIETQNVTLDEEYGRTHANTATGEFVALVVSDTGTGMSADVQQHLFEPFFTTKAPGRGTGLGLATCYGIAQQFGGHIGVYSEVGHGTTMKLYLPRADAGAARVEPARPETMPRGDETILLVEDEKQVRAIVARMLKVQGYTVIQATDGDDALQVLEQNSARIDLLLTDLVMPRMGGRELAERVQSLRPGLRVLFTSGYTEDVIMQNRLAERDILLLHKPFTRMTLSAKVREALDAPVQRV